MFKSKKRKLGKLKKLNTIEKLRSKDRRIMNDKDYKISRQIVNEGLIVGSVIEYIYIKIKKL